MDIAYSLATQHYRLAQHALFADLQSQFSDAGFDTLHNVAERSIQLHIAALDFARKVWINNISYEKAEEFLRTQFSEFPASTCNRAFSEAYTETR
jgi:hypothetical protein